MGFCHASMETGNGAITYELNALELRSICPFVSPCIFLSVSFFFCVKKSKWNGGKICQILCPEKFDLYRSRKKDSFCSIFTSPRQLTL